MSYSAEWIPGCAYNISSYGKVIIIIIIIIIYSFTSFSHQH